MKLLSTFFAWLASTAEKAAPREPYEVTLARKANPYN
jgi:hypothetical protein